MQTFAFYVQTKSNLGRTMIFAMIIVLYINNVLVISCLSPKLSVMDLYLVVMYTHWNSHSQKYIYF